MRDATTTDDDLRVAAAKEQLAGVAARAGYAEAMNPPPSGMRKAALASGIAAVAFATAMMTVGFLDDRPKGSVGCRDPRQRYQTLKPGDIGVVHLDISRYMTLATTWIRL